MLLREQCAEVRTPPALSAETHIRTENMYPYIDLLDNNIKPYFSIKARLDMPLVFLSYLCECGERKQSGFGMPLLC